MKHKIPKLVFSLFLVLNVILPSSSILAVENTPAVIDPQVQLVLDGKSAVSVASDTKQFSLAVQYNPFEFDELAVQDDLLHIELPEGVEYAEENNPQALAAVSYDGEAKSLEIDLEKANQQPLVLAVDFEELAEETFIQGVHSVNGQTIGRTEKVSLSKEVDTESSTIETDETKVATSPSTESESTKESGDALKSAAPAAFAPTPRAGNLDLGKPMSRQLPVAAVSEGQYDNVAYFDVENVAEWNEALKTTNNNSKEVTYINIKNSFAFSTATSITDANKSITTTRNDKKLVINGNGKTIDVRQYRSEFAGSGKWDIVFQNVKLQSGNSWGVIKGYGVSSGNVYSFHDVMQYGNQALEGSEAKIVLSGESSFTLTPTGKYVSDVDSATVTVSTNYAPGNCNLSAREIYIKANAKITMKNGQFGANFEIFRDGNFFVEHGQNTQITLDNTELNPAYNSWGGTRDYAGASISMLHEDVGRNAADFWPEADRQTDLKGRKNDIFLGDNTHVKIVNGKEKKDYAGAVQFGASGGSLSLGKNAEVDILVEEDGSDDSKNTTYEMNVGNSQIPVYFHRDGQINLDDGARFKLVVGQSRDGQNLYASKGPAIRAGRSNAAAKLTVNMAKNAHFEVKANNDSDLIRDYKDGSVFNVEDQAVLDLGFLSQANKPLLNLKQGTVNIPSNASYVHRIRQWNYGNFNEAGPSYTYHPIDGTKISYGGSNATSKITSLATGFTDSNPSVASYFNNNYTSNAQRIMVDPIIFNVKSIEELTNETQTEYEVKGTAEPPGGQVILSGGPFAALPDDQKQVIVNSDGSYVWKGTLPRPFYWGETIRASYVGHTDKYVETVVKDVTKPTGISQTLHVIEGETIPEIKDFIASVEDTNALETAKDKFNYRYAGSEIASGGTATITNGQETQEFSDEVIIDDTRGNDSDPVVVKMIVHRADTINTLSANDLQVRWSDVSGYTVGSAEYTDYLKNCMAAKAQTIVNGKLLDLFSSIEIENINSIPNTVGGPYPVKFIVRMNGENQLASDLIKEVNLTVASNLTKPRDPSKGNPEDPENIGTGENGELRLDYVPTKFDLGTKEVEWKDMEYTASGSTDQWVQVADERTSTNGWSLKATSTPFISGDDQLSGASLVIPEGDMFNKKTESTKNPNGLSSKGDTALTSTESTIFTGDGENSKNESTYVWKKDQVKLKVPKGQGKAGKTYQSTITWIVEADVSN